MKFELKILFDNCIEEVLYIPIEEGSTDESIEEARLYFVGILKDCCANNVGFFRYDDCIINMSKVSRVNFKLVG